MDEERQIEEIRRWFRERHCDLFLHEYGDGWRAPVLPQGVHVGSAMYGSGATPLEAALDAKLRFEHENLPTTRTRVISVEGGATMSPSGGGQVEITADDAATGEEAAHVEQRSELTVDEEIARFIEPEVAAKISTFGWRVACEEEANGGVTATLQDDTGRFLKMAHGDDFHDAILEVFKDTYPPSDEVRRRQQQP